jgi:ketosteroid isomerase-like protein
MIFKPIPFFKSNLKTLIKYKIIMRSKVLSSLLLASAIALVIACSPKKAEPVAVVIDKEQIKKEIQAIENEFAAIYTHRNVDSLTYYADDAVSYFVGQKPIVGKEAIHQFIEEELLYFPEGARIINETIEIYVSDDGDHVAEIGSYKMVDSAGVVMQNGHYMSFFVKRDGKYFCARDMATSHPVEE